MALPTNPRAWLGAVSWQVRGLFATESVRRIAFRARQLWQPAEVEARKGLARDLATELLPELRIERDRGHLMLPASAMPDLDDVCTIGTNILRKASLDDGVSPTEKKFFRIRVATRDERIALLRVALDRRMLAMVATYLGVFPVITEADYFTSFPVTGPWTKSQLWHCDDDSSDVFKLFIYCDDVTIDDGPFEMIGPLVSHRVRDEIGYRYAGRRYRVSDAVMDAHTRYGDINTITGPRGTAFAVDTVRCFHRGSRIVAPNRRRVMATICYCPPTGITLPRRLATSRAPMIDFAAAFSGSLERAALGVPVADRWI